MSYGIPIGWTIVRHSEDDLQIDDWEQGKALFLQEPGTNDRGHIVVVDLNELLAKVARHHTSILLEALDDLVREKLIEKKLDLVPGQDTGTVSFIFPVTAYTNGLPPREESE